MKGKILIELRVWVVDWRAVDCKGIVILIINGCLVMEVLGLLRVEVKMIAESRTCRMASGGLEVYRIIIIIVV